MDRSGPWKRESLFTGDGTLVAGEPVSLALTNALENTTAALVVGLSDLSAPFKGGVMVPDPDILLAGLGPGPDGELELNGTWPGGLPPGLTTWYQHWVSDVAGPSGFAASNAVAGTTP